MAIILTFLSWDWRVTGLSQEAPIQGLSRSCRQRGCLRSHAWPLMLRHHLTWGLCMWPGVQEWGLKWASFKVIKQHFDCGHKHSPNQGFKNTDTASHCKKCMKMATVGGGAEGGEWEKWGAGKGVLLQPPSELFSGTTYFWQYPVMPPKAWDSGFTGSLSAWWGNCEGNS